MLNNFLKSFSVLGWTISNIFKGGKWEFSGLTSLSIILGCLPVLSLFAISETLNSSLIEYPLVFVGIWAGIFLLEKGTMPLLSVLRVHLNEKTLAYFHSLLIGKANSLDGLMPFESKNVRDEIHFLEVESARKPMNFVYIFSDLIQGSLAIVLLSCFLSTLSLELGLAIFIVSIPHALSVMWFERLRWTETLFNSPHARKLRWVTSVAMDAEKMKEVRIFQFGGSLAARYQNIVNEFLANFSKKCWKEMAPALFCTGLTIIGYILLLVWLITSTRSKTLSGGELIVVLQGFIFMHSQTAGVLQDFAMLNPALDYFSRLRKFIGRQDLYLSKKTNPKFINEIKHGIHFESVSFVYPDGRQALKNINLFIGSGEKIALVGENGAGKSTLVKLLMRFYDPTEGRISIDGIDIRDLDLTSLRSLFSAVFQDFGKYHLSLRENIELGNKGSRLSNSEIEFLIKEYGMSQLVQHLPDGVDSLIGTEFGGTALSGGEWQKVAMARAFAHKAQILVLDEPTASLDPKSEADVFFAFAKASQGAITLFITHRLGSVSMANRIVMMQKGEIIELGTHHELIDKKGDYAEFYQIQAQQYMILSR